MLTFLLAAFAACASPQSESDTVHVRPNFRLPTLGGKQFWEDTQWYAGWRVQKHVWTGHFRLLDESNVRRAWGSEGAVNKRFTQLKKSEGLKLRSPNLVVVVHGLGRSRASMGKLTNALRADNYEVMDMGYPSTRKSLQEHSAQVNSLLTQLVGEGAEQGDFVTHSLGGIVVRHALAGEPKWRESIRVRRLAMLAPPSQGSAIAQSMKDFLPFQWVMGEVGPALATDEAGQIPLPKCDFGIVAAQRGEDAGWNPLLEGADDGVVRVEETKLPGAEDFLLVEGTHTFMMRDEEVIQAVQRYLKTGSFSKPEAVEPEAGI